MLTNFMVMVIYNDEKIDYVELKVQNIQIALIGLILQMRKNGWTEDDYRLRIFKEVRVV